jgi:hypothetical protein
LSRGKEKMNKVKPTKALVSVLSEKVEMAEGPLAPKRNPSLCIS